MERPLSHRVLHAVAAARRTAATAWRWLTKSSTAYPQPPHPDEDNVRGLGWAGGSETFKPILCRHEGWDPLRDGRRCLKCGELM